MQPHSAALILAYMYLLYQNRSVKKFNINVSYKKNKSYEIEVKKPLPEKGEPVKVELEVTGFWSCRVTVKRSGKQVTIDHDHLRSAGVQEIFTDYQNSVDGRTTRSHLYDRFEGNLTGDYKNATFYGEYSPENIITFGRKKEKVRYDAKITNTTLLKNQNR